MLSKVRQFKIPCYLDSKQIYHRTISKVIIFINGMFLFSKFAITSSFCWPKYIIEYIFLCNLFGVKCHQPADIRKGSNAQTRSAEILIDCRSFKLAALLFSLINILKLNYLGTFTYITQYVNSNAHYNFINRIFSDKTFKM